MLVDNQLGSSSRVRKSPGFTIMEVLMAIVIFSVALLALSSVSLKVIQGNHESSLYTQATMSAQATLEELKVYDFDLGPDAILGTVDDNIGTKLANCSITNDVYTDAATLFASPDFYHPLDAAGLEQPAVDCQVGVPAISNQLTRTWTVKDNTPSAGMKTFVAVVGWQEGGYDRYVMVTNTLQGD